MALMRAHSSDKEVVLAAKTIMAISRGISYEEEGHGRCHSLLKGCCMHPSTHTQE
jgi:hypothetical protein